MLLRFFGVPLLLVLVFSFAVPQQKPIFEKREVKSVKYAVAVMPGAFPKSYGYFNKAFKFNNIDPLALNFSLTDTSDLSLTEKILEEQLGNYLESKNIEMQGVINNKVYVTLKTYGHQGMTLTDKNNKKYICLNLICNPENHLEKWLYNWIEVKNGGTCYWHIILSLSDKKLLFAHPNGEA